jgi:septal ring-binding cell division protein DamX
MSTPQPPSSHGPDDKRAMSGVQRALIALAGLALLLLAFVIFQSAGGDDGGSSQERTTAAQTATATATTETETVTTTETATTATTETEAETETGTTTQEAPAAPRIPTISVVDGQPRNGVRTLSFERGERIRFRVRSNTADEVHVHGFDETKAVPAGGTALLSFEANLEGRFEVELHGSGAQIAELEVSPS